MGLEAKRADLDRVAVGQVRFLDGLAVDASAAAAAAVPDPPRLRTANDQAVNRGNFGRRQAHVAAPTLPDDQEIAVEPSVLACRVAVRDDEGGLTGVE